MIRVELITSDEVELSGLAGVRFLARPSSVSILEWETFWERAQDEEREEVAEAVAESHKAQDAYWYRTSDIFDGLNDRFVALLEAEELDGEALASLAEDYRKAHEERFGDDAEAILEEAQRNG